MRRLALLSLFAFTALEPGCRGGRIVIPNTEPCTAAGRLSAGAICAETITGKTRDLTMDEYLDRLEAQEERPDPEHPGQVLPARAGAICQSTDDWDAQKTALEQACRLLGKSCTYEIRQTIHTMGVMSELSRKAALK